MNTQVESAQPPVVTEVDEQMSTGAELVQTPIETELGGACFLGRRTRTLSRDSVSALTRLRGLANSARWAIQSARFWITACTRDGAAGSE